MSENFEDDRQVESYQSSFEEEHLQEYLERVADTWEIANPEYRINLSIKNRDLRARGQIIMSMKSRKLVQHRKCDKDLRPKGFVMRDRMKQMDFAHISLALRTSGRFHALSFALRDQRPEIFESKITTLQEPFSRPEVISHGPFITRFERLARMVKVALAGEDPEYTERFSEYEKTALSNLESCCDGHLAEPYAVLGHGDFWINNMLFKYEEGSSDPKDIYLLDFQLTRYASPVLDISYIIFCNCSQELRTKHYDELIKIYHDSLSSYLSELGSDPEKLFPYDALLTQLEKFSSYGAGMAVIVLPMITSQGDDNRPIRSNNADLPLLEERIHRDHFWSNIARDSFKDFIDRNYI